MGDRIDDLPVDQILPSKEEREILNTLYDARERYHPDSDEQEEDNIRNMTKKNKPTSSEPRKGGRGGGGGGGNGGIQGEMNTILVLALLFLVLTTPQLDRLISSMAPFFQGSDVSRLLVKTMLFIMMSYLLMNWGFLRVKKNQ